MLYSDGDKYRPAIAVAKELENFLPGVKKALVLGTGLGSIVHVLHGKGYRPEYTLVEYDDGVLKWAMETMNAMKGVKLNPVCADAKTFIAANKERYDLVFIDIFIGREVPGFVTTEAFFRQCANALAPNGKLAFNYIVNDFEEWLRVQDLLAEIFPGCKVVSHQVNRIFICG